MAAYGGLRKVYVINEANLYMLKTPLALLISNII